MVPRRDWLLWTGLAMIGAVLALVSSENTRPHLFSFLVDFDQSEAPD